MQPCPGNLLAKGVQSFAIARYGVIVEESLDHTPQPATDHGDRFVHAASAVSVKIDVAINGFRPMQLVCPSRAC